MPTTRPSLRSRFAALVFLATAASAFGCSGGTSEGAASNVPTHLDGLYESTTAGDVGWIAFSAPSTYALSYARAECQVASPPDSCVSVGSYVIDPSSGTLELTDYQTSAVTSYPIAALGASDAVKAPVSLTTQDEGLVSSSKGSLVTPSNVALTNPDGSQQGLVSTPDDCGGCPSSGSGTSGTQSERILHAAGAIPKHAEGGAMNMMYTLMLVCTLAAGGSPLKASTPMMTDTVTMATPKCIGKRK